MLNKIFCELVAENLLRESDSDEDKYIKEIINLLWSSDPASRENGCLIGNSLISQEEEELQGSGRTDRPFFEKFSRAVNAEFEWLKYTNFGFLEGGLFEDFEKNHNSWCRRIKYYLEKNNIKYSKTPDNFKINPKILKLKNLWSLELDGTTVNNISPILREMNTLGQIIFRNNFFIKEYTPTIGSLTRTKVDISKNVFTHEEPNGSLIIDEIAPRIYTGITIIYR